MEIKNVLTKEEKIKYLAQMDRERKFLQVKSLLMERNNRFLKEWRKLPFVILKTIDGFKKEITHVPPDPTRKIHIVSPLEIFKIITSELEPNDNPLKTKIFSYRGKTEKHKNFNIPIYEEE